MKKLSKILLLLLIIVTVLGVAVSCKKVVPALSVKEDAQPQLIYVLGEELDLSRGVLLVNTGKKTEEVAMNADGVTVSGYDKTKLGEQTLTVSYGGGSTTLKVTVVERMTAVEYIADYLVGDEFDKSKGRLRITRNDGTTYTVLLSNSGVKIEGFDSSAAGTSSVKAKYTSGDESYETTFSVNVHNVESITLRAPNKKAYNSHDSGLVLDGGYLTLTGNGGKISKDVKLTSEEVEIGGFNLDAVNENTPTADQKITVSYNGGSYYFDIKITYTGVSMFNDNIEKFADLNFESEQAPEISKELGELALELMELYAKLSKADSLLIKDADLIQVARTALSYGYNAWVEDVLSFEGAFEYQFDLYYGANLYFTCESREAVVAAIEGLAVTDRPIYSVYDTIVTIGSIDAVKDEVTKYVKTPIIGGEMFSQMIPMFRHMLDFYDNYLPLISENWATADPETYKDGIETVYAFIKDGGYVSTSNSWIYDQAATWLANYEELKPFDALYTYYYGQQSVEALYYVLPNVKLPTAFDELVNFIGVVLTQMEYIGARYEYDTTEFFYNYFGLIELVGEYTDVTDESTDGEKMLAVFYYTLPVNVAFSGYESAVTFGDLVDSIYLGGVVQLTHALHDVEEYNLLMNDYMAAVKVELDDKENYVINPDFGVAVEGMLGHFLALNDIQQNMFLSSLMPYYMSLAPELCFAPTEEFADYTCRFVRYLNEYFDSKLTDENSKAAYTNLMSAYEIYTRRFDLQYATDYTSWIDDFKAAMTVFNEKLTAIETEEERSLFLDYFEGVKDSCDSAYARFQKGEIETELGDWQAKFDELDDAIIAMNDASYGIDNGVYDDEGYYFYNIFFSAYERARSIADYIITEAPAEIVEAYYHARLYVIESQAENTVISLTYTYDYMLSVYRSNFMIYVVNTLGGIDVYNELGFAEFFDLAYDLLIPYYNSLFYEDYDFAVDKAKALAIMDAFSKLQPEAKAYHRLMEGGIYSSYYGAIDSFVTAEYSEAVVGVVYKLVNLEYFYIVYQEALILYPDEADYLAECLAKIETIIEELKPLYTALVGEDKTAFADFEALYSYYVELCENLILESEAPKA